MANYNAHSGDVSLVKTCEKECTEHKLTEDDIPHMYETLEEFDKRREIAYKVHANTGDIPGSPKHIKTDDNIITNKKKEYLGKKICREVIVAITVVAFIAGDVMMFLYVLSNSKGS